MAALAVGTTLMTGCAKKSTEWVMAKQATTTPILDVIAGTLNSVTLG